MAEDKKLAFASDYMEGAHPDILTKLVETNMLGTSGYGTDEFCDAAKDKIRKACNCPEADIYFLVGGTQTNATVIDALLRNYQGALCADTGHINAHEAGAVEFGGHKVLTLPHTLGKINAAQIKDYLVAFYGDDSNEHMVMPGLVYLSQPTEYGTLYSLDELTQIRKVCDEYELPLYIDGARLAYALASDENDVTLEDMARLCDVFYIGGTKCGALFGEALVFPKKCPVPRFVSSIKQRGGLLAKGRLLGIQYDVLFTDDLYLNIGKTAIKYANRIQDALIEKGYQMLFHSPTNQLFFTISDKKLAEIGNRVAYSFWGKPDAEHTIIRFATSWATSEEAVETLISLL